jgi:hypothetical protein
MLSMKKKKILLPIYDDKEQGSGQRSPDGISIFNYLILLLIIGFLDKTGKRALMSFPTGYGGPTRFAGQNIK